jgi:hypothetical protein
MKSDFKVTKDKGGFGITLGCEGTVIAMSIAADHGDTEMKFNCTVSARENDGQTQNDDLGCFKGKESHNLLERTILKEGGILREGIKKLQNHSFLCAEWENGINFMLLPTAHCGNELDRNKKLESLSIIESTINGELVTGVRWGDDPTDYKLFDSIIPENANWKCLPIILFMTGDLACTFMLQVKYSYNLQYNLMSYSYQHIYTL